MVEKFKHAGGYAMGLVIVFGFLAIPVIFLWGSVWASTHLLRPLIAIGQFTLAVDFLILLPLSVFRKLRSFTGTTIMFSSYLFGLVTWLLGFVVTYELWGAMAVIIGVAFIGLGVVPIGMAASAWNGLWELCLTLLVLILVTWGARFVGLLIAASGEATEVVGLD